uniref:M18 family aminopeptidase n=1 Tax=Streptomyces sp. NBC_01393 TaxID=2903851 RepID=A0AAU3IE92_9ACTN
MHARSQRGHSDDLISYIQDSPSAYHAVAEGAQRLERAGFRELCETEAWTGATGGCYVVRDGTLIAWYAPPGTPAHTPFRILGAHTDLPHLRVVQDPDTGSVGWRQIGTRAYGNLAPEGWADRDLGVSGRLTLRDGTSRLVRVEEPLLRVARPEGGRPRHSTPLWGLGGTDPGGLLGRVAAEADVEFYDVLGHDLVLHDMQQPGYLGGAREFLVSARLDNLVSVHAGLTALVCAAAAGEASGAVPVLAAVDHDVTHEQGEPATGGVFLERVLRRSVAARGGDREDWYRALGGTFGGVADLVRAVHPEDTEHHGRGAGLLPNGGPVVRTGRGPDCATDGRGLAVFAAACERAGIPWRTSDADDVPSCGPGLGPLIAGRLAVPVVDIGVPGLSLHSARELCGADDPWLLARALTEFITAEHTDGKKGSARNDE